MEPDYLQTLEKQRGEFDLFNLPTRFISFSNDSTYKTIDALCKKNQKKQIKTISNYAGIKKTILINLRRKDKNSRTKGMAYADFLRLYDYLQDKGETQLVNQLLATLKLGKHGGIDRPRIPISFRNKEGVCIIADILTDGCFSEFGKISYYNTDPLLILDHITSMGSIFSKARTTDIQKDIQKKLFNIRQEVINGKKTNKANKLLQIAMDLNNVKGTVRYRKRKWKKARGFQVDWSTDVGSFLKVLGVLQGNKVTKDAGVPEYLFGLSNDLKYEFVARIIANDGTIGKDGSIYIIKSVQSKTPCSDKPFLIKNWRKTAPKLLINIHDLLNSAGLNLSPPFLNRIYKIKGKTHLTWYLSISGRNNLLFKSNIQIPHLDKQKKLKDGTTGKYSYGYQRKSPNIK